MVSDADRVYAAPSEALAAAREVLAAADAPPHDRAEALWVLGRSAYYANRIDEAVGLLRQAAEQAAQPDLLTEVLLMLAPALSKQGHPDEALALLAEPALELEPRFAGQLHNQRSIVLTELGRLPDAEQELRLAVELLGAAGDTHRECRALVNLGVVTSLLGRLDESERWYAEARRLAVATGQGVVAAGIEGNLGYVESRRGNFAAALDWYARARTSFDEFGEVDLLVAVLETDHARTLLDVGLFNDAVGAAERAVRSAAAGGNQMLESAARLTCAEALVRLGDTRRAAGELVRGRQLAERLGQAHWVVRADYLAGENGELPEGAPEPEAQVDAALAQGWIREAFEIALQGAARLRATDPGRAIRLLADTEQRTATADVDPVDRALGALVFADLTDDPPAAAAAWGRALVALADQRDLLGSIELRATITQRLVPVRDVAFGVARRLGRPADDLLDVLEAARAVRADLAHAPGEASDDGVLAALRSARVDLAEAKWEGADVGPAAAVVRELEQRLLGRRRTVAAGAPSTPRPDRAPALPDLPAGVAYVTYAADRGRLIGLVRRGAVTAVTELGAVAPVVAAIRSQRAALRRLADQRRRPDDELVRLALASAELERLLIAPLRLDDAARIALTPGELLGDTTWGCLPALAGRGVTLTPSLARWTADAARRPLDAVAVMSGPALAGDATELGQLGAVWGAPRASVRTHATCAEAIAALRSADLVHVAAHGVFRSDNPFFSALLLDDGELSLLEISTCATLPALVVLASCDTGAAAGPGGTTDVVVSTAAELAALGAQAVVAPSVAVADSVAAEWSIALHRRLATGAALDAAMVAARGDLADGEPRRAAGAHAFQLFGTRAAGGSLPLS